MGGLDMEKLTTNNPITRKDTFINLYWKTIHLIVYRPTAWSESRYGFALTNFRGWTLDIYLGSRLLVVRLLDKDR